MTTKAVPSNRTPKAVAVMLFSMRGKHLKTWLTPR